MIALLHQHQSVLLLYDDHADPTSTDRSPAIVRVDSLAGREATMNKPSATRLAILLALLIGLPLQAADTEDQFFDSAGVRIRYKVWGVGEPIVLVHGFTAQIEGNWEAPGVVEALTKEFKVIALDTRGHGKSDKPHDPAAYGSHMGDDVIRLLDHLGIEQAHVVGYSMGGFLTLDLVTRHPNRFITATIGGAGFRDQNPPGAMDDLIASLERGEGITPLIERLTPAGQPPPDAAQLEAINNLVLATNDPMALAAVLRGLDGLGPNEDAVRAIEVPLLAAVGDLDPLRAAAERLKELLPAVELHLIEGRDHMTAMADPAFVAAIRDFIIRTCNCA